jgi:hypothetical protein
MIENMTPAPSNVPPDEIREISTRKKSRSSILSWGAMVGGAFVTAALSFVLFFLGDEPQR